MEFVGRQGVSDGGAVSISESEDAEGDEGVLSLRSDYGCRMAMVDAGQPERTGIKVCCHDSRIKTALKEERTLCLGPEEEKRKEKKERREGRMCVGLIPFSNLHSCLLYGKAVKASERGRERKKEGGSWLNRAASQRVCVS